MQEWESIACVTATNYAWSARLGWYVRVRVRVCTLDSRS